MDIDLKEFKQLYAEAFGVDLTDKQSEAKARAVLTLYKAIYGSPEIKNITHENIAYAYWSNREGKRTSRINHIRLMLR